MNYTSPFSFAIPQQEEVPYLDSLRQNATKRRDPREEDLIRAVERKVQEAILRDYQAPEKPTSLEDVPQAFGEGLGEGLGSLAQYAVSPQGKQITAALIGQSNPHLAKGFYTSGLQEQKDYNARLAAYQQARERQGKGALDYLKSLETSKRADEKAKFDAKKAAKEYTLAKGTRTTGLKKDFNNSAEVKSYKIISEKHNQVAKVWDDYIKAPKEKSKNALDQVLIMTFNKILDPTSVVRESEFGRTAQGQSLLGQIEGYLPKLEKGGSGLTDEERQDIVDKIELLQEGVKSGYERVVSDYTDTTTEEGLDPKRVTGTLIELSKMSRLGGEPKAKEKGAADKRKVILSTDNYTVSTNSGD